MGTGESHGSRVPALPRTALWLTAYVFACLLGRIIIVNPHSVVIVWPASGLALVWLASALTRKQLVIDTVLLSVSTAVVIALTDGSTLQSVLALLAVIQTLVALWLIRRWVPHLWGAGGRESMSKLSDFGRILAAVAIGALVMAVLRTVLGLLFVPGEVLELALGRWGRNAAAMATIGVFGLLLGGWVTERRDRGLPVFNRPTRDDVLHGLGVVATTTAIFVLGFYLHPSIPSTFMLTLTVVWCAIRFNLVVTAAHSLLTGAATVLMTILGYGPVALVGDSEVRALLAETFVVVLMVISMTIALTRRQFFATIDSLQRSESALAMRAQELDMVMSHLEDGVAIIEEGGRVLHANAALLTAFGTRPAQPLERAPRRARTGWTRLPPGRETAGGRREPPPSRDGRRGHRGRGDPPFDEYGVLRVLECSAFPVPNPEDAPQRVMIVLRDMTAASSHRESLVSFAGTVAHDLNNPLSVIDGWAEALRRIWADSEAADATGSPCRWSSTSAASVEQRVASSPTCSPTRSSRDQTLRLSPIPLRNLVKHIVGTRDRPRGGGEIVAGDLLDVWADQVLLRQVLDNLIGNAFKYVAPDVTPRVLIEAEHADDGWARVMIRDNGIGIPAVPTRAHLRDLPPRHHERVPGHRPRSCHLQAHHRAPRRAHPGDVESGRHGHCFEFTLPTSPEALASTKTG